MFISVVVRSQATVQVQIIIASVQSNCRDVFSVNESGLVSTMSFSNVGRKNVLSNGKKSQTCKKDA